MKNINVNIIPQLKDNYSYIIESQINYFAVIVVFCHLFICPLPSPPTDAPSALTRTPPIW